MNGRTARMVIGRRHALITVTVLLVVRWSLRISGEKKGGARVAIDMNLGKNEKIEGVFDYSLFLTVYRRVLDDSVRRVEWSGNVPKLSCSLIAPTSFHARST